MALLIGFLLLLPHLSRSIEYKTQSESQEQPLLYWHEAPPETTEKEDIIAYIESVFLDDDALKIAKCESSLNPKAYNPETHAKEHGITKYSSYGIFQLNRPYDPRLYNYKHNIDEAKKLYDRRSWFPWLNCMKKL